MQFNPGDNSGICDEIDSLCDSDSTSHPIATKTRRVNSAYETVVGWLITADGTWQFDDTNYTTNPVGTTDLVEGQSSYSFGSTFLDIMTVKIKDINGHWHIIQPLDQSEMEDTALEEYLIVNAFPEYYDKEGDTIKLYPAPASNIVTLTSGMKIEFQRTASLFTTADTTKQPGFASPFHVILAYMAARPYCMTYKKDRVAALNAFIGDTSLVPTGMKKDLILFYSKREKDKRKVLYPRPINFK